MLKSMCLITITLLLFINNNSKAQLSCSGLTSVSFSYTGAAQTWVVPAGITSIRIKTKGGDGGAASATSNSSGGGAIIEGEYTVTPGATVTILVGGKGPNGDNESGGGGATGIYIGSTLYIVAGGGGGEDNTGNGGVGVTANNGTDGLPVHAATACPTDDVNNARGGTGGNGGFAGEVCAANNNGGGGGGGLNSAGGGKTGNYGGGGQGSITGGNGGAAGTAGTAGAWGWSGGGGGDDRESGGGGGYAGGGGGGESGNPGGGGSFLLAGSTSSYTSNGTSTTSPVDGTVTICYLVTTPVSLLSFSGISANNCNTLYFTTEQEINVNKFVIERSLNGAEFKNAGEITATNTTTRKNYQFRDFTAGNSEKWLYRIKVLDNDGKYKYSSSIVIKQKGQSTMFAISPNPSTDKIYINSSQVIKKIEIINTAGANVISKTNINLTEPVYINTLTPGLYIVKAYAENEILVSKFIKK
jgi:hypothetical protein